MLNVGDFTCFLQRFQAGCRVTGIVVTTNRLYSRSVHVVFMSAVV
jgi:hypothetical protein